jgi:parvulin-like peptidyl-prolyl isomerase
MYKSLLMFIALSLLSAHGNEIVYKEGIIAKVNGKVVTSFELNAMTTREQRKIAQTYPPEVAKVKIAELKKLALDIYIDNLIILDEFKAKGFTVPQALIDKDFQEDVRYRANGDSQKFAAMLDAGGLSMEEYKEQIRDSIAIELMKNENVNRKVTVTPIEIAHYYDMNLQKFVTNLEVRLSLLRIAKEGRSNQELLAKIATIQEALAKNENFADLADKFSEMPDKNPGGDWGFKKKEELLQAFRDTIEKMKVGDVSAPIYIGEDAYIVKLTEIKGGSPRPLEEVRNFIKNSLTEEKQSVYYKEFIQSLRQKSSIEDYTQK